jgi:hypothetical protein
MASKPLRPFGFLASPFVVPAFVGLQLVDDELHGHNAEVSIGQDEGVALGVLRLPGASLEFDPRRSAGVRFEQLHALHFGQRPAGFPGWVGGRHFVRKDEASAASPLNGAEPDGMANPFPKGGGDGDAVLLKEQLVRIPAGAGWAIPGHELFGILPDAGRGGENERGQENGYEDFHGGGQVWGGQKARESPFPRPSDF